MLITVCVALALFATGMLLWNARLRTYASECNSWFKQVHEELRHDAMWTHEADRVWNHSTEKADQIETHCAQRFIPYSLAVGFALIALALAFLEADDVHIIKYGLIGLVSYLVVSGRTSYFEFMDLYGETAGIKVVLESKVLYDGQIAADIQEILDEDEEHTDIHGERECTSGEEDRESPKG